MAQVSSVEIRRDERNNYSLLPVTALQFCCVSGGEVLLEGEGPKLKVFSKDGSLLCEDEVLPFNIVHGIQVDLFALNQLSSSASAHFLVFGQKSFRLVKIVKENDTFMLCNLSEVLHLLDWILAATFLSYSDPKNFKVALVTAHNALIVCNVDSDGINYTSYQCEVNSILYSAEVVLDSAGDLVIVSGTAFNEVLLWYVSLSKGDETYLDDSISVRLAIGGHDGAIFSVRLSNNEDCIVSASDDRTVRVWNLPSHWKILLRSKSIKCSLVLYGHTSRVWDAMMLPNYIVSIGEDATCRVWNYDGQCLSVIKGHKGRSVWSLAIDCERNIVATGGEDSSIRTFHLASLEESSELSLESLLPPKQVKDMPRSVLLYNNTVLLLTSNGYLYAAAMNDDVFEHTLNYKKLDQSSSMWTQVHVDPEYSEYCVACLSESGWLALGNLRGHIKLIKLAATGKVLTFAVLEAHRGKVFSLKWTHDINHVDSNQLLFSCGPEGNVICWLVGISNEVFTVTKMATFVLPPSKHRWLSAVLVLCEEYAHSHTVSGVTGECQACDSNCTIVCGDRRGCLHVFKCTPLSSSRDGSEKIFSPLQSLRVHGPNGVTFITLHKGYVYSAGRDGNCRQFRVSLDGTLEEVRKFKPVKGMDWIEELMFTSDDLLVLGFQATNLVVHSTGQNKHIVCTSCGGGHRSYGFSSQSDMISFQKASLVYIKQSTVNMKRFHLDSYFTKVVFQLPLTGREAISLAVINSDSECGLLAVGSEDCSIYIIKLHPQLPIPIRVMRSLQGHISSVRALSCSQSLIDKNKHMLFSGGARASLKAWTVVLEHSVDVFVSLEAEIFLYEVETKSKKVTYRKPKPKFSFDSHAPPEFRVMSLASFPLASVLSTKCNYHYIAAGCSDAHIRQYIYNEGEQRFLTLPTINFHKKCVLKVLHHLLTSPIEYNGASLNKPLYCSPVLCSSSTDGTIALWDLQCTLFSWVHSKSNIKPSASESDMLCDSPQITSEDPMIVIQPHQSGVNDIAVCCNGYDEGTKSYAISVATVGDDNALVLTRLKVLPEVGSKVMAASVVHQCSQFRAHSSSITGVQFIQSSHLLTTSIDQRINMWIVTQSNSLILTSSYTHDVADVSSLCTCNIRNHVYAVFCGIGIQCYCFTGTIAGL